MKSFTVVIALTVCGSSGVAFARDHQELVCAAVGDAQDNGDKIPLFVHFFENRSADGTSRDETLSTVYQTALFQAKRINKSGTFSNKAPIVLLSGKAIRFRGTYTIVSGSDNYVMKLAGEVNDDPFHSNELRKVSATLKCVDLSI